MLLTVGFIFALVVQLKADISRLRYSRNKNLRSPSPSRNLRHAQSSPRSASRHRQYSNSPTHRPKPRAASAGRLRSSTAPKFDFEAEEGRRRAAERIRVKRLEMRQKEAKMRQREYQKKQERWDIRDEKVHVCVLIAHFIELSYALCLSMVLRLMLFLKDKCRKGV